LVAALATAPAAVAEDEESRLSGFLTLDADTNFMSYGLDVWATGTVDDLLFHPAFGLAWDLGSGFSANIGTWWDVNDNADSSVGGKAIQEVDVWFGLGYSYEKLSTSVTYQEWMYAGASERIVDFNVALDVILQPSFTVHGRVDGNNGQDEGAVFVLGAGHTFDFDFLSLSPGANLGFVTEDYYQPDEGGFAYVSAGLKASVPLTFVPAPYGAWDFHMAGTYYYTDPDNINNPHDNIFTGTFGLGLAF
jgi:hypothetical protein